MTEITFNLNWYARVKLTEEGKAVIERKRQQMASVFPQLDWSKIHPYDSDGILRDQLHQILELFGPSFVDIGMDGPIYTDIVLEVTTEGERLDPYQGNGVCGICGASLEYIPGTGVGRPLGQWKHAGDGSYGHSVIPCHKNHYTTPQIPPQNP